MAGITTLTGGVIARCEEIGSGYSAVSLRLWSGAR
jgi:hypothetical protein